MGSFIHYCKHCNAKLNVDNAWLGKSMKCPACNKKITFPSADGVEVQSVPTINLASVSTGTGKGNPYFPSAPDFRTDSDLPSAPDFPAPPDMPFAPDFKLPDPPETSSVPSGGSTPRRIKLKPLSGKNETVPSQPNISLPPADTAGTAPQEPVTSPECESCDKLAVTAEQPAGIAQEVLQTTPETISGNPVSFVNRSFFKGSYFWGRLGSASVYVLAAIALLMGFYFSWHLYCDYRSAEDLIPEKQQLAEVNKELNEREKKLSSQFKNAINLLQGSGTVSQDGVLDGLLLPDEICRRPDPMPLGLLTSGELKKAQQVLEQYRQSNRKLKEEFVNCFGNIAVPEKAGNSNGTAVTAAQIILQAGEVKKQFYTNEQAKLAQLTALENTVARARKQLAASGNAAADTFKRFEAAGNFVRKQLFPAESNITVVKSNRPIAPASGNQTNDWGQISNLIASLANGWQLDLEIASMEMLLEKVPMLTKVYEKKKSAYLRVMGKEMVKLWIQTLLAAFALLILGDVLRAFFDKADILHRMEGKK